MSVRVQGTTLTAPVDGSTGAFSIADVPAGTVTLLLVEEPGKDTFTQASKRVAVSVTGDVTNAAFNLQYHWQLLAGYPSVWGTSGYDHWETFFLSDQVGFIIFSISGTPPRMEIYGTGDGGASWSEVGHWEKIDAQYNAGTQTFPAAELKMFWADATHGVVLTTRQGPNVGFLRTANGGASWSVVNLPLVETAYNVNIDRFAKMSSTHWIAAGWIGMNVQGYNSGFHSVIWETTNAGASWQVAHTFAGATGCTGLAANSDGDAVCFRTPYGSGSRFVSVRSGSTAAWSTTTNADIVINSGYGPADVVMIGDTAWVGSNGGTLPNGLYRSTQAGAIGSWTKISEHAVGYLGFGSTMKAFGLFGGPAYVSYDGGSTWLYQSGGGGYCCHGNDIFAFDSTHAVWRDYGEGDPDGVSSIYTYSEPWTANFEVLPGASIPSGCARAGETNVPAASLQLISHGPVPLRINSLTVAGGGTGNDATDITAVKLWLDANKDGMVGTGDTLLDQKTYSANDGAVTLNTGGNLQLNQLVPVYVVVSYDFAAGLDGNRTFNCSVASANVVAEDAETHAAVVASAPAGQTISGPTITSAQLVFEDDFETGLNAWTASTEDTTPDAGYGWKLSSDLSASASQGAYIHEDRGHDGWATRHYLTLAAPLDLSAAGTYYLAFNEYYALEPSPLLHVEASSDAGASWQTVRTFGNWESNSTNGVYVPKVYDLIGSASGSTVLVRFQLDWTSGWYFNATWAVDDVRVYRVPPVQPNDDDPPTDGTDPDPDQPTTDDDPGTPGDDGDDPANPDTIDGTEEEQDDVIAPPAAPLCGFGLAELGFASLMLWMAGRRQR